MSTPEKITATYRIVTPMFIGDANQDAKGITAASVKGALRFWWRALNWGRIYAGYSGEVDALKALHEEEAALFGSPAYDNEQRRKAGKQGIGQSKVWLRVTLTDKKTGKPDASSYGIQYLLGQGLYHYKNGVLRNAILSGKITVECLLHPDSTGKQKKQLQQALLALGTLGGLGSRNRKGFGALAITSIKYSNSTTTQKSCSELPVPQTQKELITLLQSWKCPGTTLPPFTAFSEETRIDLSLTGKEALTLLGQAGEQLQLYRSWGKNNGKGHMVNGTPAEQNFKQSHDLMLKVANKNKPTGIPDKAVFGLPQNYFFSSTMPTRNVEFSLAERGRSRRASPLFIHPHQFPGSSVALILALLPATFLENNANLGFVVSEKVNECKKIIKTYSQQYQSTMTDWKVITDFMDRSDFSKQTKIIP